MLISSFWMNLKGSCSLFNPADSHCEATSAFGVDSLCVHIELTLIIKSTIIEFGVS